MRAKTRFRSLTLAAVLSTTALSAGPVLAVGAGDEEPGLNALTRTVVAGAGTFQTMPFASALPEGDLIEKVNRGRHGIHARIHYADDAEGEHPIPIGSRRNMRTDLDDIPERFLLALLATEDSRFFEHPGLDLLSTTRASAEYLRGRVRGASGITQQLIKNQVTGADLTFDRKITEALLALRAEAVLSKREIMQAYLGAVWFGRAWGAASAPETWFARQWSEITLSETAFLAGLLQGPALLHPGRHPERAHARRNMVLDAMLAQGFITEQEHEKARDEEIVVTDTLPEIAPPSWEALVVDRSVRDMNITNHVRPRPDDTDVPIIRSSLERSWQDAARQALETELARHSRLEPVGEIDPSLLDDIDATSDAGITVGSQAITAIEEHRGANERRQPAVVLSREGRRITVARPTGGDMAADWIVTDYEIPGAAGVTEGIRRGHVLVHDRERDRIAPFFDKQGAVLVVDNHTGSVLASIGGTDVAISAYDRTVARRQPGSSMKGFVWLAALEYGMTPHDTVSDRPRNFAGGYRPRNYGGSAYGAMPLYTAFEVSSNVVSVSLADEMGIQTVSETALMAGGYDRPMDPYLPSALGASSTRLSDLVQGYATIVNGGREMSLSAVRAVMAADDTHQEDAQSFERSAGERLFKDESIESMLSMMRGVITRGTATRAFADHPVEVVGKTGTSQEYRDALFIGSTADVTVGVWIGRDDNQPMGDRIMGGSHAAPVAADVLEEMYEAGIIDRYGRRDGSTITMDWPPEAFGETRQPTRALNASASPGQSRSMSGSPPSGQANVRTQPLSSNTRSQSSGPPPGGGGSSNYFTERNRNEDLLR